MATRDARNSACAEKPRGAMSKVLKFRVTEAEHARLSKLAAERYGSVSAFLRACVCNGVAAVPRVIEIHDSEAGELARQINAARIELSHQGRNLNQATKALNRAALQGTLDRQTALNSMALVKDCETVLAAVDAGLDELEPTQYAVITRVENDKGGEANGND